MPNWCSNTLDITGPAATLQLIVANHVDGSALDFETVDPTPKELLGDKDGSSDIGLSGWYKWRLDHWGCKWNMDGSGDLSFVNDEHLFLCFDTPWRPPTGIVASLGKRYPDCEFELGYVEEGNQICGTYRVSHQDGVFAEDDVPGDCVAEFGSEIDQGEVSFAEDSPTA